MSKYTALEKQETLRLMADAAEKLNPSEKEHQDAARELLVALGELDDHFGFLVQTDIERGRLSATVALPSREYKHGQTFTVRYEEGAFMLTAVNKQPRRINLSYDQLAQKFVGPTKKAAPGERHSALAAIMREILEACGHKDVVGED
jgi:hypothetical protein